MLFGWELRVPLEAPQGFREAVVKAMFGKEMGQAEFPWRSATVMSRRQRHIYIYISQKLHLPTLESTPKLSNQHQGTEQGTWD